MAEQQSNRLRRYCMAISIRGHTTTAGTVETFAMTVHSYDTPLRMKTIPSGQSGQTFVHGLQVRMIYFQLQLGMKLFPWWVNWCCSVPSASMLQIWLCPPIWRSNTM